MVHMPQAVAKKGGFDLLMAAFNNAYRRVVHSGLSVLKSVR